MVINTDDNDVDDEDIRDDDNDIISITVSQINKNMHHTFCSNIWMSITGRVVL